MHWVLSEWRLGIFIQGLASGEQSFPSTVLWFLLCTAQMWTRYFKKFFLKFVLASQQSHVLLSSHCVRSTNGKPWVHLTSFQIWPYWASCDPCCLHLQKGGGCGHQWPLHWSGLHGEFVFSLSYPSCNGSISQLSSVIGFCPFLKKK